MSKKIKNIDSIAHSWGGVQIEPASFYECLTQLEADKFVNDNNFIFALSNSLTEVYSDTTLIIGASESLKFLANGPKTDANGNAIISTMPFAAKAIGNKKLYKRIHGVQLNCVVGENVFEFVIPYNMCKISGLEIVGCSACDTAHLEVYDTATGTISGVPNYKLNQFGFAVNLRKDYYEQKSEYDADLYLGMKMEVHVFAQNAGLMGVNFILNELK